MRLEKFRRSIRFDGGRKNPGMKAWRWALIVTIAGLIAFLAAAEKPWDGTLLESIGRREADGKPWKVEHYAAVYLWWAALGNLVLTAGLLITSGWWARPLAGVARREQKAQMPRWFWMGLMLIVGVGAWERIPRLNHSFWNDEEYGFRTYIWGVGAPGDEGALEFEPVSWQETFFRNKSNNHIFYSVFARISHGLWRAVAGNESAVFKESVVRFIPFLAGLGSLVAAAYLLAMLGRPVTGLATACFLALNPWHLRYSVEARGYAYVLLFGFLALVFLLKAMRSGRWSHWLAYSAVQFVLMLSYPGSFYLLLVQNGIAFAVAALKLKGGEEARAQLGRLVVANIVSGMAVLQVLAPSLPQIREYLAGENFQAAMGWTWLRDWWTHCCAGIPWQTADTTLHGGTSLLDQAERSGITYFMVVWVLPFLLLAGIIDSYARDKRILLVGAALLGGALVGFLHGALRESWMHVWYVLYGLGGAAILICFGVESVARLVPGGKRPLAQTRMILAVHTVFLCMYAWVTADARARIRKYDRQPLRSVVQEVRGESPAWSPAGAATLTGSFGTSKGMIKSYDPWDRVLKGAGDLEALIEEAEKTGKPLFVYLCGRIQAHKDDPEMLAMVEDGTRFEKLPGRDAFKGLEELFSYHVYRYRGK